MATGSIIGPFRFMGPRNSAYGRHTIASAAPSNNPVARVGVDKYNRSILLMHRSPIVQ